MQPPVEPVRDHLTAQEVADLIELVPGVTYGAGLEVTDLRQDDVIDISGDLQPGGSVERSSYATLHGSCQLEVSRWLDWPKAVLRPYMTIAGGGMSARFNLGAYFTSTPEETFEESPPTYGVTGYDILHALNSPVGDAYAVAVGDAPLTRVEAILLDRGFTKYLIDPSAAGTVMTDDRTWALDPEVKWLTVVNDLLGYVGYAGIWSDWNGLLRCGPYETPRSRRPEWVFTADVADGRGILGADRRRTFDYFDVPNRWVIVRGNLQEGAVPIEGDGVYTYQNDSIGPTSIEARGGVTYTRHEVVDAASQAELIAQGDQIIDADMTVPSRIPTSTAPFPLAWHFDRYYVDDPKLGPAVDVLGSHWSLPLNGDPMVHEWTVIDDPV